MKVLNWQPPGEELRIILMMGRRIEWLFFPGSVATPAPPPRAAVLPCYGAAVLSIVVLQKA